MASAAYSWRAELTRGTERVCEQEALASPRPADPLGDARERCLEGAPYGAVEQEREVVPTPSPRPFPAREPGRASEHLGEERSEGARAHEREPLS